MATFTGESVRSTYGYLVQIPGGLSTTLTTMQDALGASLPIQISTTTVNISGSLQYNGTAVATIAPADASYIVKTADSVLSNEFALSTLATGYVKVTTTTGDLTSTSTLPTTDLTGTLQAAQFPALTGDITTSAGALATTLATVNSNVGSFGTATQVGTVTVNGKGLVTAASNTSIQIAESQVTNLVTDLGNKQPLDGTLTALAAYNTNGVLCQTAADTFAGRTITGTADRVSVSNGDGVSGNPTLDISATYVGQSTITTLGTITTGTWTGTTIAVANGGTGQTSYTDGQLLIGNSTGNTLTKATLTGTSNKLTVTNGGGSITLTLPATLDLSGNTYVALPSGAGGTTIDAAGKICVDTTSKTLNYYNGTAETTLDPELSKTCVIQNSANISATEKVPFWKANAAYTVTKIHAVIIGGTSATYKVFKGSDLSAAGTAVVTAGSTVSSTTTGTDVTSFDSASIAANDLVWVTTTAVSGSVTTLMVTVFMTRNA